MEGCIFCKIANGQIPSSKIYEDNYIISFLDIAPANKGHALILPKQHFETFLDIPNDTLQNINMILKKIIKAMSQAIGNKGYNILMNNYKVAGQVIPHAHMHLIPRFNDDKLNLNWAPKKYKYKEVEDILNNIKKFM